MSRKIVFEISRFDILNLNTSTRFTTTKTVTTGPYISVKNVILEKLKPANITRKRYEEVTTKAVSYCAKKYPEEGYSFKLWKTELLTWVKLFSHDKFPGIRPQSNKEKAAASSKAQANSSGLSKSLEMASRPAYGGKTIPLGDITIMDEGEPMTIESTHKPQPSTNSSMDAPKAMRPVLGGKTILLEDTPMTDHVELITTAPTSKPKLIIRSSMNPPTSSATPLGASLRGFGNLGATKPRTIGEKAVPAKATSSNLDFLPDAQPAGIAYCKTWPGSDHPYTEPTQDEPKKSAEQETEEAWKQAAQKVANRKADQEHWTNYRQGVLDGRAKRENECKTDVLRAKNTGGPLLPLLDNGMPQFSVTVTFSLPVPDRTFKGKWGKRNLNRVQGNLQVLIRYKHFGDKFVVWAEPKKARYKDNGQHLDICYETVGFLKSWESAQAKTVRRIRLNEHYKAWKAGTKGVEKSIYRHKNYKEWDEYEEKSRDWVHLEEAKEYYNGWKSGPGKESAHVQRLISGEARYDEWQEKPKETTEKRAATPEPRGRKRDREEEEEDYAADDEDARPRFSPFRPKKTSAKGLDGLLGRLSVSPPESPECPVKKSRKN